MTAAVVALKFKTTRARVDAFAASHPRFDELGTLIQRLIQKGLTLDLAYRLADRFIPPKKKTRRIRK